MIAVGSTGFPPTDLLAFGFVNPALLGGLGLAAVPVIIHWLSRRYFRRIEWAATRFLLEAEKENRRRARFEQWLLLALRCLALALLALLVARPYVHPGMLAALLGGRGPVTRILVLDDSASLAYRTGTALEFVRLKAATNRLLSWLQQEAPRDPVTLYLTSAADEASGAPVGRRGEPLIADAVLSQTALADLRERLSRCDPVNTPARPRRTFERIAERLAQSNVREVDVYVLSDFQRTDWLPGSADGPRHGPAAEPGASVFEPLRRLNVEPGAAAAEVSATGAGGRHVRMILVASGVQPRDNVALVGIELERPQTVAGSPAVVRAQVANFAARPVKDLVVQVETDGAPLPAVPAGSIEADGQARVSLEVTFADEGYHVLALTVGPVDSFRADDTRRRVVHVKSALAVLVVNGAPAADPHLDEVYLLRNALAPSGPLSSGVRVDVIDPEALETADLNAYDVVFLCNVAPPREAAVAALQQFVRAGGGLIFCLGSDVGDPADYNRAWYADGAGLLPLPLERLVTPAGQTAGVGLVRTTDHPVTAMFPAGTETLSEYVHFWQYYRCAEPAAADVEENAPTRKPGARPVVLARFTDSEQSPALIERAFGRGRVLLFTSSIDLDWNDWAQTVDGSYVVTMLELVQYLARQDTHPGQFLAGEPLTLPLSPDRYELTALFKPPAYPDEPAFEASARAADAPAGEDVILRGPLAARLGTYSVELTPRTGLAESRPLCVNFDPAESDLAVATASGLDAALTGIPHTFLTAADDFLQSGTQTRRELWPAVLTLLIATLLCEQALAWWFGAPRTAATAFRR